MTKKTNIQLFVGLGNPGDSYNATRHNAGVWFIEELVRDLSCDFRPDKKLKGELASTKVDGINRYVFRPMTYMNVSGQPIRAICQFYKIPPEAVLIAHDDLDLPAGNIKIKFAGGHGGHNGLRDTISHLGTANFHRLRIGIGHPGQKDLVHDYVLGRPSVSDKNAICAAIDSSRHVIPLLMDGDIEKAMTQLHTADTN
jgi:peptidyl-tRNA hydrolase, PTH1 family